MENLRRDVSFGNVFPCQNRDIRTKQRENALFLVLAGLSQIDDLSANRFANRFDVTHMSLKKPDDICSIDFLGIEQKSDNFEKQRKREINSRNERLD